MIYAPHHMSIYMNSSAQRDLETGRAPYAPLFKESTRYIPCRCDDNTTKEFRSPNGETYRPLYHIVFELTQELREKPGFLKPGNEVEVYDGAYTRAKGRIYMVKRTNYFNYVEIWI